MGFLSGLFGKRNKPYETYHENGQLQFRGVYVAGKPDGPFESYYENGDPALVPPVAAEGHLEHG